MRGGGAEALPFVDDEFDVAMSVMSDHHWADPIGGLREMRRVARRVVVFGWDSRRLGDFWLVRDYLPEFLTTWHVRRWPTRCGDRRGHAGGTDPVGL